MFDKKLETMEKVETIIGSGVKVEGTFASSGNVIVRGEVQGSLATKGDLRVEDGAIVKAEVKAGNAYVAGKIKGNLTIEGKLSLSSTANIEGDISCSSLLVEEGATINGHCSMGNKLEIKEEPEEE
jgi:cytoskeletal protein CcmA (bactofilin family)